jgi:dCTP deaminase
VILTGQQIIRAVQNREIDIQPFDPKQVNPNSYDLRLSPHVLQYVDGELDAAKQMATAEQDIGPEGLVLQPGQLYLMSTVEWTSTSRYVPSIEGRSSIGRLGISVHATAGFGDVGFSGTWTLEVSCIQPVRIYAGMRICQVYFNQCALPDRSDLYHGKYSKQVKPRPSGIWGEQAEWAR